MTQPKGFVEENKKHLVYLLTKSLYNLDAGINDLIPILLAWSFHKCEAGPCAYFQN